MAAATTTLPGWARTGNSGNPRFAPFTLVASATAYATASGGLPFDLTNVLTQGVANPIGIENINPYDVIGVIPVLGTSTNGFLPCQFAFNPANVTYTQPAAYPFEPGGSNPIARPTQQIATAPATIRFFGTGSANRAALGEIADGNVSDTVQLYLVYSPSGPNS